MSAHQASRTAVVVCQGRAAADGRIAPDRFSDPVARSLLRPDETVVVEQVRAGEPPDGGGPRMQYEFVARCAELMAPRTVAIDDAIRAAGAAQLVLLGAGLDGRAWRLDALAETTVYEVDHPASQHDKRDRVGDLVATATAVHFVAVDFGRDDLDAALAAAGHDANAATTWVWEGVVPYLSPEEVEATAATVAVRSARGSHLVVNYQERAASAGLGRLVGRVLCRLLRMPDPWEHERHRSAWTPESISQLLARHSFAVDSDRNLLQIADGLGLSFRHRGSLRNGRVLVARKKE